MKIAIDINDVVRDFSNNFIKYYITGYNREYDLTGFEMTTNELDTLLPFPSNRAYQKFKYEDYSYELFAKCPVCTRSLEPELVKFIDETITDIDSEDEIEVMFVSPFEYGLSIPCTMFFLSKIGCRVREIYFPTDSATIWDKCDILITANPSLMACKPDGKKCVKIKADYNSDCEADYTFPSLAALINDENNLAKILAD